MEEVEETEEVNNTKMKVCTKCGKEKEFEKFNKDKSKKDGLYSSCKKCKKLSNAEYRKNNKDNRKRYVEENKEKIKRYMKEYRKNNKEKIRQYGKRYVEENRDKIIKRTKEYGIRYREKNKTKIKRNKRIYNNSLSNYNTYAPQIKRYEEVRRDLKNPELLQVRCTESSCRKWFNPTNLEVKNRIQALNSTNGAECRFYCSKECKENCCIYNQNKYYRGFNKQKEYRDKVSILTDKNYVKYYKIINPNNFKRNKTMYQIDHIYSVQDGFENDIPVEIISSPINLRMLSAKENNLKHSRSDFTKKELYIFYNQFKQEEEIWNNNFI